MVNAKGQQLNSLCPFLGQTTVVDVSNKLSPQQVISIQPCMKEVCTMWHIEKQGCVIRAMAETMSNGNGKV